MTNDLTTDLPPLPVRGEVLFTSAAPDWQHHARLAVPPGDEWAHHAAGYRRAAELLRDHLLAETTDLDILVYPMVYSFRHYFELELKHLILDGAKAGVPGATFTMNHNLIALWQTARAIIKATWSTLAEDHLTAADDQFGELAAMDPGSFDFRYPVNRAGTPSRPRGIGMMNVRHFSDVAAKLISLLEAAGAAMAHDHDMDAEIARDVAAASD